MIIVSLAGLIKVKPYPLSRKHTHTRGRRHKHAPWPHFSLGARVRVTHVGSSPEHMLRDSTLSGQSRRGGGGKMCH